MILNDLEIPLVVIQLGVTGLKKTRSVYRLDSIEVRGEWRQPKGGEFR